MNANIDNRSMSRSQLFSVRIWREELAESHHEWRGKVQHVSSGEAFYFRRWSELAAHLEDWLDQGEWEARAASLEMKGTNLMSTEANKALLHRFFEEIFNQGNLSMADKIVAEDYLNNSPAPGEQPGRAGLKDFAAHLHAAFPDVHFHAEDQVGEGDRVVTRLTITGTQQGEFAGIPATGKAVSFEAINIHRVADGQVQEGWLSWDALGMMQQLGVIPSG